MVPVGGLLVVLQDRTVMTAFSAVSVARTGQASLQK